MVGSAGTRSCVTGFCGQNSAVVYGPKRPRSGQVPFFSPSDMRCHMLHLIPPIDFLKKCVSDSTTVVPPIDSGFLFSVPITGGPRTIRLRLPADSNTEGFQPAASFRPIRTRFVLFKTLPASCMGITPYMALAFAASSQGGPPAGKGRSPISGGNN